VNEDIYVLDNEKLQRWPKDSIDLKDDAYESLVIVYNNEVDALVFYGTTSGEV
jgi:hypothetical protein